MNETVRAQVRTYLEMGENELLFQIARNDQEEIMLHSPEAWIARGRELIAQISPKLRELVCGQKELLNKPEAELAIGIANLIAAHFEMPLAILLAVYIVKQGIVKLCGSEAPGAGRQD